MYKSILFNNCDTGSFIALPQSLDWHDVTNASISSKNKLLAVVVDCKIPYLLSNNCEYFNDITLIFLFTIF